MSEYTLLHQSNIIVHVITGSAALILGVLAIVTKKGSKAHNSVGRFFLYLMTIVIITGLMGVFFFKGNLFLLVITGLSGYPAFSGYRVLKNKNGEIKFIDVFAALITASSAIYFVYYIKSIGMMWSPVIIYSTLGGLFLLIAYDLMRYLIPTNRYKGLWLYEHIYKLVTAWTALLAAFIGTVLPQYHPYSQFLPSLFGLLLAISFIVYYAAFKKTKIP